MMRSSRPSVLMPALGSHGDLKSWAEGTSGGGFRDLCIHFLLQYTSAHTVRAYWRDLSFFQEFCGQEGLPCQNVEDISPDHGARWRRHLQDQGLSTKSIERKMATLSALLRLARSLGHMDKDPFASLPKMRGEVAKPTQALLAHEVRTFLAFWDDCVAKAQERGTGSRAFATAFLRMSVVRVLLGTGMRVGEVLGLTCSSHRGQELIFQSKGNRLRKLVLDDSTQKVLLDYKALFRQGAGPQDPIFVRVQDTGGPPRPLSQQAVDTFLRQGAKRAALTKVVSAHSLRATYATLLHQQGVGIVDIQERLGHSHVNTTGLYTKRSVDQEGAPARRIDILGRRA